MALKIILFDNYKRFTCFYPFNLWFYQLVTYYQQRGVAHCTILFKKGWIEQILRAKIWLYVFGSGFLQVLIEFLFDVSICCSFCNQQKKEYLQVLMPS